jgi:hypothetical protein
VREPHRVPQRPGRIPVDLRGPRPGEHAAQEKVTPPWPRAGPLRLGASPLAPVAHGARGWHTAAAQARLAGPRCVDHER